MTTPSMSVPLVHTGKPPLQAGPPPLPVLAAAQPQLMHPGGQAASGPAPPIMHNVTFPHHHLVNANALQAAAAVPGTAPPTAGPAAASVTFANLGGGLRSPSGGGGQNTNVVGVHYPVSPALEPVLLGGGSGAGAGGALQGGGEGALLGGRVNSDGLTHNHQQTCLVNSGKPWFKCQIELIKYFVVTKYKEISK